MPSDYTPTQGEMQLYKKLRDLDKAYKAQKQQLDEMQAILEQARDAPKWIEDIPGVRVPFIASVDLTIAANSTTRVEGNYPVSQDGPFVITAIALYYRRTTAPYDGIWGPASTFDLRIAPASQQLGYAGLFDQVIVESFNVELSTSGTGRNWQNIPFASALFAPQAGGLYTLAIAFLANRADQVTVAVTPTRTTTVAAIVQAQLHGFKVVQGSTYQP